jgi:hypothetical protein
VPSPFLPQGVLVAASQQNVSPKTPPSTQTFPAPQHASPQTRQQRPLRQAWSSGQQRSPHSSSSAQQRRPDTRFTGQQPSSVQTLPSPQQTPSQSNSGSSSVHAPPLQRLQPAHSRPSGSGSQRPVWIWQRMQPPSAPQSARLVQHSGPGFPQRPAQQTWPLRQVPTQRPRFSPFLR